MKPVTVILALVVAGLVLAGAVILSSTGPRAAARTPQGTGASGENDCTATTPSSVVMPTSAVAGGPPAGGALRGRIDALTPPVRQPTAAYRAAPATPTAECTTAGGQAWDPGNIISDHVFYNTSSMTVEQIRDFITTHGEGCSSPWCLKSVRTTVPAQSADQYCQATPGAADVDAATVIATVSAACGINPQVMLITLQKESQLLDHRPDRDHLPGGLGLALPGHRPGRYRELRPGVRRTVQSGLRHGQTMGPVPRRPR